MFNIDDVVLVVKKVTKEDGWDNSWVGEMDDFIGREFRITYIDRFGVELYDDVIDVSYAFPKSALYNLTTNKKPEIDIWKERFMWLAKQHWVEFEARGRIFPVAAEDVPSKDEYLRILIDVIDGKILK